MVAEAVAAAVAVVAAAVVAAAVAAVAAEVAAAVVAVVALAAVAAVVAVQCGEGWCESASERVRGDPSQSLGCC